MSATGPVKRRHEMDDDVGVPEGDQVCYRSSPTLQLLLISGKKNQISLLFCKASGNGSSNSCLQKCKLFVCRGLMPGAPRD